MKQVAVVTGAAKGLGKAIALALSEKGYTIVLHYQKSKIEAVSILETIKKISPKSIIISADLTQEAEVEKMYANVFAKFGRVDLLVNNVGNFIYKELSKTTNKEFMDIIESNIYSTLFCSRAVLPYMRKVKSGYIINIGVVGAERFNLRRKATVYFLAKNGIYLLTKNMAWEEAKFKIHINMVSPASLSEDIFKKKDFPMHRSASYKDVINSIFFLLSKDGYYINGANIEVAGSFIGGFS